MLIFLFGAGALAIYQVMALEDQLDSVTRAVDKMDGNVKHAQHEKNMYYGLARDVLRLAPKDPNAEQIVVDFKIRQLAASQPALMALNPPTDTAATNAAPAQPTAVTNSAPERPLDLTNPAPQNSPAPPVR
jgi:hypothetical protein